uniref:Nucleolar 27S pre-rRNA processing Urb2/Npa2 C-terminal domain-containing protein n=1 Tax=Chenopodium quinoa TaxID=63459 RepID=A0A803LGJ9_CHEQI
MAGSTSTNNDSMKKKKRKLATSQDLPKPSKTPRKLNNTKDEEQCTVAETQKLEKVEVDEEIPGIFVGPHLWRNLDLALAIQNNELNEHKKVELMFEFVISRAGKGYDDSEKESNTLSISRLIERISDRIQSLLITSAKKIRAGEKESEGPHFFMDCRCWEILKFCLKESERLHVSLRLSRDLLRVISCVAKSVLHSFNIADADVMEPTFTNVEMILFNTIIDCLKLIFSSNCRLLNENLDLWAVAVSSVLELVIRMYDDISQDSGVRNLITEFSCLVLEPFSKFLRLHPCRKNGFRDFVDKLLESLLHLLGLLHDQIRDRSPALVKNLVKLAEEILSYGLFHSIHLDEYLSLNVTDRYSSADQKLESARTAIKSYHRHLFDKVENLVSERKIQALSGIGELFRLFVISVKKLKRDSQDSGSLRTIETQDKKHPSKASNLASEKSHTSSTSASETRKILSSMVCESAYLRTEDSSGGACLNFFKISYGLLMSCYAEFNPFFLSTWSLVSFVEVETLNSLAKEFILVVGNFLDIEYGVIGDDLVSIWLMILTCLASEHSSENVSQHCKLYPVTVDLGCRLINLYSELRQVDRAVFALCKGLRHISFYQGDVDISSLHYDKFSKSGCLLLFSQKFRLAICNVIKSIPEGQAVDFVQILSADVLDCLEWMKVGNSVVDEYEVGDVHSCRISAQAKILGVVLSEIYTLVLDSLSVSAGYSYRMGESIEELIVVLRPSMRHLTTLEQDGSDEFVFSVLGITQNKNVECKNDLLNKVSLYLQFFFRVYVSCRSLYRQTLSLMPPDSSKKMSNVMSDFYTAYSGKNCMERTKFKDKGYFSWVKSSVSLLSIMQHLRDNIFQEGSTDYCCLIYVMHMMALQRLVDLSRQIHCVEYHLWCSENGRNGKSADDADKSLLCKDEGKQEKLEKFLSALKQETSGLTNFIMKYLSTVDENEQPTFIPSGAASPAPQYVLFDSWDLGVCTVNEKTLPTAIWWIICYNIDLWCHYATKKKLKLFLSLLILNSLPYRRFGEFEKQYENYAGEAMKVTKHQISQELLRDTSFYDQRFVRRYMPSRVCHVLKKCISRLFNDSTNAGAELGSSDWTYALGVLQNSALFARDKLITSCRGHGDLVNKQSDEGTSFTPTNDPLAGCQSVLNLLCKMCEITLSFKSFSHSVIYLINFERLIIGCLLGTHRSPYVHDHHEFLRLLVSCRRALKYILMAFCADKAENCIPTNIPILSEVPSSIHWLLESVKIVSTWWSTLSSQNSSNCSDLIVSLRDQTSYVFVTLCKHQFYTAIQSIASPTSTGKSGSNCDDNLSNEFNFSEKLSNDVEVCKGVIMMVEVLEEETKKSLLSLKEAFSDGDMEVDGRPVDLSKLSSVISCIQGLLWGLECALNDTLASGDDLKVKVMKSKDNIMSRVVSFMNLVMELIGKSSRIFLHNNHPIKMSDGQGQLKNGIDTELENQIGNSGSELTTLATCDLSNGFVSSRKKKRLKSDNSHSVVAEFSSFNYNCLKIDLLGSFLKGQNLEAAFFLRGLFIVSSAIVRLSVLIDFPSLSPNLVQNFLGCSEVLLTKFSEMLDFPSSSSFVWLDGSVKFLEAIGSLFASTSSIATRNVYTKLVELHLKAIGKCSSLQGKGARLASHIGSSAKIYTEGRDYESTVSDPLYGLDNLKARLRMSFKSLIEKPSEPLLLSALQALERALFGLREGFPVIYEVKKDGTAGGRVSAMVAGSVDCLDLLLEFYKGKNQLNVIRSQINSLFSSLFNIIVHLQGPSVFHTKPNSVAVNKNPDSGSMVLMCVEVLTRISGKRSQFHLDSHHVRQSLRIPAALFQGFCFIKAGKDSHQNSIRLDGKECEEIESYFSVDRQFSVNLYAASCRLLWTVVKHRNSECIQCIAELQISLQALLYCLEIINFDSEDRKAYFTWVLEDGVKCASYLRRVYEEIGQQKDNLGQHCFMFLSEYIKVYSGYGPLKMGIKREVDEALRPGIYALLDVCSADDLQHLHTKFGEGTCRSTLASLKDDHKRQQYEGKV